jgi:pre-rRNA-processing protein IPI1
MLVANPQDPVVRRTLHEFLGWYLARLPGVALSPYLPLLQLQISSALSHIFPGVRIDACKLVELLLETHAGEIIAKWPAKAPEAATTASAVPTSGSTIFDGLRLSAGLGEEKGASSQGGFRLTTGNKLVILRTIKTFIARALESTGQVDIGGAARPEPTLGDWTLTELNALPADQWSLQTTSDWGCVQASKDMLRKEISTGDGAMEELSVS